MSLPPSSHPSADHQSQAGASAIAWWKDNYDQVSDYAAYLPAPPAHNAPSALPPSRITIPVQIPDARTATAPATIETAPPASAESTPLIDLLTQDSVASTNHPQPRNHPPTSLPTSFPYPTPHTGFVLPQDPYAPP
jgi:hypothetical protein